MKVLVINSGSSSLKYQLFDMKDESVLAKGIIEEIGTEQAIHRQDNTPPLPPQTGLRILEHKESITHMLAALMDPGNGCIASVREIAAVGHRIAHGGEFFSDSALVDNEVLQAVRRNIELAPLHNPANLKGIEAFRQLLGEETPMVCVFDTAFHQTMPQESYMYPLPRVLYDRHKIRRYGFHGTSHKYVSLRLGEITGRPLQGTRVISCHIGNGASITAIRDGKSVDTSMGMTPLEGLMMGTRCGDIDPAIIPFVMAKENLGLGEINSLLNKHSGLAGVSGQGSDLREIIRCADEGHEGARLALNMYVQRIRKYIGSYCAVLNGLDTLIFTGGVGENSDYIRAKVCESLTYLGLELDPELNRSRSPGERKISTPASRVAVHIIPTNEELMIARDTQRLVQQRAASAAVHRSVPM
ncbi:acetate/propionate family kinase [Paenibacillus macerans]|uniref:Acetate kinase n=1 Tax=Paenibacillus macerans TaxID=44252 RepID=A0A091A2M3_PAEMA|nr:acetate kinase [Paenibacillus macerans]KFN10536.1 acetate kinase [Paenibacillus macerans]MCY7556935.1 acetate kinase [Paenibacillus macerans]MEC0150012.1 acetate kinase [Paenibacillus macerans]MEC0330300.1 acetate kinase [Paenibacillus macerans]MED4955299.1 acetate kinase [Paenibacillus macerans]